MDLYSIIHSSERLLSSIYKDTTTYIVTGRRCSYKTLVSRLFNKDKLLTDEEVKAALDIINKFYDEAYVIT